MDDIFNTLLFLGVLAFVYGFIFVKVYSTKHDEKAQNFWGWISMLLTTAILLVLFSVWSLKEPLSKGFFPAFLVISLIGGLLARESLISPYKLAKFWGKLANKNNKKGGQNVSD